MEYYSATKPDGLTKVPVTVATWRVEPKAKLPPPLEVQLILCPAGKNTVKSNDSLTANLTLLADIVKPATVLVVEPSVIVKIMLAAVEESVNMVIKPVIRKNPVELASTSVLPLASKAV